MDELIDLIDSLTLLGERASRRRRWLNWLVRGFAVLCVAITLLYGALLLSNRLTGWPPD